MRSIDPSVEVSIQPAPGKTGDCVLKAQLGGDYPLTIKEAARSNSDILSGDGKRSEGSTGRPRKYATDAERQKAYRQRKALQKPSIVTLQNVAPGVINNPPVRYFGGKWRIADWIIAQFPPHVCYVEPFCGGASILFSKPPSKYEVINDLNSDITTFFEMLRTRREDLLLAIYLTPHSREEHRNAHSTTDDPLEKARRFYIRSRQSYGTGEGRWSSGWRFQANNKRGHNSTVVSEWNNLDPLWQAAVRLKQVQIENDDALKVIERFDTPETLFYVDPPYLHSLRYDPGKSGYKHEMTDDQHRELAARLQVVQGMVLLSGYDSTLYEELYPGWRCIQKATKTNDNHDAIESLWISPKADDVARLPLFEWGWVNS